MKRYGLIPFPFGEYFKKNTGATILNSNLQLWSIRSADHHLEFYFPLCLGNLKFRWAGTC